MKPWGGRFRKETDKQVEAFTASLPFDYRLAEEDIEGSLAHCKMLVKCGILTAKEGEKIQKGLTEIKEEIKEGKITFDISLEDIHMNVEKRLIEKIGPVGGKLHTARSRNDQVALDMHMYVKKQIRNIMVRLKELQQTLVDLAEANLDAVLPGYTHLQRAQPVLLAQHFMAYFWMFMRDQERFRDSYARADLMPLGAGALAGTGFRIDREMVARELGFSRLYENSMDAVSDRDFILEFLSNSAILVMHLSRLSEELILWSTAEFGFIELDDAFTTGSSIMPQKKNPDVAELGRAKCGRVYGNLIALLTVMKGLPLTYNKDMQEDKEGLFDTADTVNALLSIFTEMLKTMKINKVRMKEAVQHDFGNATDLADYLAGKGVPFREAHTIVGKMVAYCLDKGILLSDMTLEECRQFHPDFDEGVKEVLNIDSVINARTSRGGTSLGEVRKQLNRARELLSRNLLE